MRLILLIFLVADARQALTARPVVSRTRLDSLPITKSHTLFKRALDSSDGMTADADDDVDDSAGYGNNTETLSEIDKAAFAVEVDTDDPQGVYLPLEKLKMMIPGPGVKPRPRLPSTKDIKKKDQPVKKRRRRNAIGNVREKSLLSDCVFPRNKSSKNFSRRLVEKSKVRTRRVVTKSSAKQFRKDSLENNEAAQSKFSRIQKDGNFENKFEPLTRRKRELKHTLRMNELSTESAAKAESEFPSSGNMDDHRTKEWLKKELNSIETLMNATKHRLNKVSPEDKAVISPQLERDLQNIDHDIHIDLKHVSNKHKHDDDSGVRVGARGEHYDHTISLPSHPYLNNRNIEILQQHSQHRIPQHYESEDKISVDTKGGSGENSNQNHNDVDIRETARLGDSQRVGEHWRMPDISRMLDELEWIKHQTDVVRNKARKIEIELRVRQRYMNRKPDVAYHDRLPEEHRIHVSIKHGSNSRDKSRTKDYFQRHTGNIPHKYHYGERTRVPDNEDLFKEMQHQNQSPTGRKDKPITKDKDKTIISTFDRLQHDLKTLRMKMEARDKFDGTYSALDTEPIPKVPPIFNANYFRGEPVENEMNEITRNRTVDRKFVNKNTNDMKHLGIKIQASERKTEGVSEEHEDFEKLEDEEVRPGGGEFRLSSRGKRSLSNQANEYATKISIKFMGKLKKGIAGLEDDVKRSMKIQFKNVIHKFNQLISKISILKRLKYLDSRMKDTYWPTYKSLVNRVQKRLAFYIMSCKRLRLKNAMMREFGKEAVKNKIRHSEKLSELNDYVTHKTYRPEMRPVEYNRESNITDSLIFRINKSHGKNTHHKDINVLEEKRQKNSFKMEIGKSHPSYVENVKNKAQDSYEPIRYPIIDKRLNRMKRHQAKSKEITENENEPALITEKELKQEFSQLLNMLPESQEEKDSETKLYMDDMKKEKAFDISQTIRKVDNEEREDADFLKESIEANYLLANSRIRRYNDLRSNAKKMLNGKPVIDFSNIVSKKSKRSIQQNKYESPKTVESIRVKRSKRSVNATPSANLTTTTQVANDSSSVNVDTDAHENFAQRDRDILNKDTLHMMDYYEGKQENVNPREKRRAAKKGQAALPPEPPKIRIPSENYEQNPDRVNEFFDSDYEPSYLDTFFPQAYASLRNARDRMRWFRLLDGEDRLARQVGYLNNMADRLLEEETDPVLQFLNHVEGQGEPDKYRSWARAPTLDYGRRDHSILKDAIHDFNNNEHERNAYLNEMRDKRDIRSNKYNARNDVTKNDINYIPVRNKSVLKITPKVKNNNYQFDESQLEEFDEDNGDNEADDDDDDDEEEEDDDDNEDGKEEFEDKHVKDYEDEDRYNDEADDEKIEEKEKGIEVDDNGQKIESEEPFAFIERKLIPKHKASKQVEYFWGSWSPCSQTCGIGQRFRSNMCGQDQPCAGRQASTETEVCADVLDC